MINIICLGKLKEDYLVKFVNDYYKRISKYHKIKIIELKDENDLEVEANNILKYISNRDYVITCDLKGEMLDSIGLAKEIDNAFLKSGCIDFIIGSSYGIHDKVKSRADKSICFSKMTIPHGVFRGLLLEQIYRSFKINNNENYHK